MFQVVDAALGSFLERLARKQHFPPEMLGEILPARVHLLDQRDLLLPPPTLELFFAPDRFYDFVVPFVVNQAGASVLLAEPSKAPVLCCMIRRSKKPVTPVLRVTRGASHNVDPELLLAAIEHGERMVARAASKRIL
jgi:hypothetical protein